MLIPSKSLEFEIQSTLVEEIITVEDHDDNGSIFMREFVFLEHKCNHILNVYRFNFDDFAESPNRIDRFAISFFDYAEWYNRRTYDYNQSNNPANYTRYYCSKNTGPAWNLCRSVAGSYIGYSATKTIGPTKCTVEKVSDHLLKYTEEDQGLIVPLNNGAGCLYWEFEFISI